MSVNRGRAVTLLLSLALLTTACGAVPDDAAVTAPGGEGSSAEDTDRPGDRQDEADQRDLAEQQQAEASVADVTREEADLVVWADESRSAALAPLVEAFADEHGVTSAVQAVPFEQIRDQFQVTGPDGDGPDVFIGAHEWLGEFVPAGLVAPVDLGDRAARFEDVAVSAVTYDGRSYGVPYALSSVALLRNTEHVASAPRSWEDLLETVRDLRRRGAVTEGVVVPGDPYHLHPITTALGGYLFGRDAAGDSDASDLGLDSPGSLEAARRLQDWAAEGVVEVVESSVEARERFDAGEAAFAILDPAGADPDDEGVPRWDVAFDVSPVPPVDGGAARPFVRAEAVMVSAFAADADLARRFVLDHVADADVQAALAAATGRPPAHQEAAVAPSDPPELAGFAASAREGVPLPALPETGSAWGPWAEALERVLAEGGDPQRALPDAAEEVRGLTGR